MKTLNRKKAQGYDEIPTAFIKDGANILAKPLASLINKCLENSLFPSAEKCAKITPIYKSEERSLLDNYRPISILPVLSKVFERVIHRQLYAYLEENDLLSKNQFGFRTKSSTQHAVTKLSDSIRKNMDKGLMTGAVFVDLRKAFDTVDHARLFSKLTIYGIRNEELLWFEDYLFNRTQFVAFDGTESLVQPISCDVPQGSIQGPLMFVLSINDIDIYLKCCEIILYADDTVIYYADKTCEKIEEQLNHEMELISNWFVQNNLVVNLKRSKTECVLYGTHHKTSKSRPMEIKVGGTKVVQSQVYEYLGVTMDENLNYIEHLQKTIKKATSRVKLLYRIRQNLSPSTAEIVYKMMILPIMLYCNTVYLKLSTTNQEKFETVQNRALRVINGQRNSVRLPSVNTVRNRSCALAVFKCLNGLAPKAFEDYFKKVSHGKCTRANNMNIVLPKIKTETGRKTFAYQGAIIFNKLSNELKTEKSLLRFRSSCKDFNFDF